MRPLERLATAVAILLLAGAFQCIQGRAAELPEVRLQSVEKELDESREKEAEYAKQADSLAAEIATLRGDSVAAAQAAQAHEAALSTLEDQLVALTAAEKLKAAELKRHRAQQIQLLMSLERLARNPPEGLMLSPGEPIDIMRSGVLIGAAVPPIEREARVLREEIATLAGLRQQIAEAESRHRGERLDLDKEQSRLAALIARKAILQEQARQGVQENSQRQMQLASQAADLQQLIERMAAERKQRDAEEQKRREDQERRRAEAQRREAERQARAAAAKPEARGDNSGTRVEVVAPPPLLVDPGKPKAVRPFAKARGHLVYPASGQLMRRYGENDEFGMTSKGLTFETRPGGQVIAPFDGRVLFSGPFKGYGQILIIEHGDGYHSLLAGLDRIEGSVGQWLIAGEPVGTMPKGEQKPHLYLELRHDGQPINPMPWLATRDEKVSG